MRSDIVDLVARARTAKDPGLFAEWVPYARAMGIEATLEDEAVVGVMRYRENQIGNRSVPALHGGVIGALLETTALFQLLWTPETSAAALPHTINITFDYLRTGRPMDTYARAEIARLGRRVANVAVAAWQGGDTEHPIALAHGNFALGTGDD